MKKLFTLLTSLALISSGASQVIACNEGNTSNSDTKHSEQFELFNLSTWGKTEKELIKANYLKIHTGNVKFGEQDAI